MPTGSASPITSSVELVAADGNALDRALGGAHAAADLGGLEGRPGRRGRGHHPLARAQRDLGVGADVDEQPHAAVAGEAGGQHARPRCRRRRRRPAPGTPPPARAGARARRSRAATAGGSRRAVMMNGAMPSGSGSMPSASCIMVTLPQTTISYTSRGGDARPPRTPRAASRSSSRAPAAGAPPARRDPSSSPTRARSRRRRTAAGGSASSAPPAAGRCPGRAASRPRWWCPGRTRSRGGCSVVSPGSTSISTSSQITAVTLKSDARSVRPRPRAAPSSTRSSKSSTAAITRSRSDAWSSSDGSSSSR